jgi:hypothetical protein
MLIPCGGQFTLSPAVLMPGNERASCWTTESIMGGPSADPGDKSYRTSDSYQLRRVMFGPPLVLCPKPDGLRCLRPNLNRASSKSTGTELWQDDGFSVPVR